MKKHVPFIMLLAILFLGSYLNADAQRTVVIEGYPLTGDITPFIDVIHTALDADAPNRVPGDDVTYILKRDQLYPITKPIKNTFTLKMVAEEGTGAIPVILTWEDSQGKYSLLLEAQADVYFENIQWDNRTASGTVKSRCQNLSANGIRGEFRGCVIEGDDGAAFTIANNIDSCSIFLYDCFVHNCGTEGAYDSNGRLLDIRGYYADSVVVQNCTADHINGSFVRAGNAVVGYLKIDHNTCFNSRSGNLSLQFPKEAIITNNLFKDSQMSGDVPSLNDPAETNPDKFHSSCIMFDTLYPETKITIRNNNVFYTDEVKAMWAKYDTIYEPLRVNPMAMRALGDDSIHAAFSEFITFKIACSPPIPYIEGFILDASTTVYPSQHCSTPADSMDCSYETSSASYTAGDDGYPLGDLNWWPELKAKWEKGEVLPNGLNNRVTNLFKVYPNPAKDKLFFSTADQRGANIILYDILGKELLRVLSNGGDIEVNVGQFPKGMYIYRVADSNGRMIQSGKVLIAK